MKLTVVIPAYNEEKTIESVIQQIPKSFPAISEIKILIIDDGSTDKTAEIAKKNNADVYSFPQNKGLAKAISKGFEKCLENRSDIMVILDADNQYVPEEIPLILDPIIKNQADIVLGDRQVLKLEHMPTQKRIGNTMFSKVVSTIMGQKINDAQTGFRAFNRDAMARLFIFSGYTYTQETLLQAKYKNLKIVEVPITFRKRADHSRLISNIFTYAFRSVSLIFSTIIFYKSFKFFSILSIILFGIGVSLSIFLLDHLNSTGQIKPHYPTTILTALFLITATISALMTIISSILRRQSALSEEIVYMLKKNKSD